MTGAPVGVALDVVAVVEGVPVPVVAAPPLPPGEVEAHPPIRQTSSAVGAIRAESRDGAVMSTPGYTLTFRGMSPLLVP